MSPRARIGFSIAGVCVFAFILLLMLFDSNWLRGPIGAAAQGGLAAVLSGLLSPLAAILPFVEPGLAEDVNCAALMAEGKARGAPVRTPARR